MSAGNKPNVDMDDVILTSVMSQKEDIASLVGQLQTVVHKANAKWWVDIQTGQPLKRNVGELLMLTTSELAEALEGHRKSLKDDHLTHRSMFEVELADAIIRILDIGGGLGLDIGGALAEKMIYNLQRRDHKHEERLKEHGKKY